MRVTIDATHDPEEIVELLRQVQEEHRYRRPDRHRPFDRAAAIQDVRSSLSHNGASLFVARMKGECVGYVIVRDVNWPETASAYGSKSLMVDQIAVSNAHRRRGIGTRLLELVRAEAARRGADRMELLVASDNEGARRFYEAQGFARFHDIMESSL